VWKIVDRGIWKVEVWNGDERDRMERWGCLKCRRDEEGRGGGLGKKGKGGRMWGMCDWRERKKGDRVWGRSVKGWGWWGGKDGKGG